MTRLQWSALAKVAALAGLGTRATDPGGDDPGRARCADRGDPPSPPRQSRAGSAQRRPVRRADHLVPSRLLDAAAPQDDTRPLGRAGRGVGVGVAPAGGHTDRLYRSDAPVAAASTMVRVEGVLREFACWLARHAPEVELRRRPAPSPHRGLQAAPGRPALGPRRALSKTQPGRAPRRAARLLRTAHRVGRRRRPRRGAGLRRRPAAARRAAAAVPRRRRVHQAAAGRPRRPRPVHPPDRGVPGPHRAAQRRIPRPHRRLGRADRRRLLAARAARQAAHRPIHPAAPPAQRARSTTGSPAGPPACAALPVHRARPAHQPGPRRPGRRQDRPGRRDRARQPAPAPAHAGHPGDQPGHVASRR